MGRNDSSFQARQQSSLHYQELSPPAPPDGRDDLWELQFCRWWGWNWVPKRGTVCAAGPHTTGDLCKENVDEPRSSSVIRSSLEEYIPVKETFIDVPRQRGGSTSRNEEKIKKKTQRMTGSYGSCGKYGSMLCSDPSLSPKLQLKTMCKCLLGKTKTTSRQAKLFSTPSSSMVAVTERESQNNRKEPAETATKVNVVPEKRTSKRDSTKGKPQVSQSRRESKCKLKSQEVSPTPSSEYVDDIVPRRPSSSTEDSFEYLTFRLQHVTSDDVCPCQRHRVARQPQGGACACDQQIQVPQPEPGPPVVVVRQPVCCCCPGNFETSPVEYGIHVTTQTDEPCLPRTSSKQVQTSIVEGKQHDFSILQLKGKKHKNVCITVCCCSACKPPNPTAQSVEAAQQWQQSFDTVNDKFEMKPEKDENNIVYSRNTVDNQPMNTIDSQARGNMDSKPKGTMDSQFKPKGTMDSQFKPKGTMDSQFKPKGTMDSQFKPKGTMDSQFKPKGTMDSQFKPKGTIDTKLEPRGTLDDKEFRQRDPSDENQPRGTLRSIIHKSTSNTNMDTRRVTIDVTRASPARSIDSQFEPKGTIDSQPNSEQGTIDSKARSAIDSQFKPKGIIDSQPKGTTIDSQFEPKGTIDVKAIDSQFKPKGTIENQPISSSNETQPRSSSDSHQPRNSNDSQPRSSIESQTRGQFKPRSTMDENQFNSLYDDEFRRNSNDDSQFNLMRRRKSSTIQSILNEFTTIPLSVTHTDTKRLSKFGRPSTNYPWMQSFSASDNDLLEWLEPGFDFKDQSFSDFIDIVGYLNSLQSSSKSKTEEQLLLDVICDVLLSEHEDKIYQFLEDDLVGLGSKNDCKELGILCDFNTKPTEDVAVQLGTPNKFDTDVNRLDYLMTMNSIFSESTDDIKKFQDTTSIDRFRFNEITRCQRTAKRGAAAVEKEETEYKKKLKQEEYSFWTQKTPDDKISNIFTKIDDIVHKSKAEINKTLKQQQQQQHEESDSEKLLETHTYLNLNPSDNTKPNPPKWSSKRLYPMSSDNFRGSICTTFQPQFDFKPKYGMAIQSISEEQPRQSNASLDSSTSVNGKLSKLSIESFVVCNEPSANGTGTNKLRKRSFSMKRCSKASLIPIRK